MRTKIIAPTPMRSWGGSSAKNSVRSVITNHSSTANEVPRRLVSLRGNKGIQTLRRFVARRAQLQKFGRRLSNDNCKHEPACHLSILGTTKGEREWQRTLKQTPSAPCKGLAHLRKKVAIKASERSTK